jgi:hypothetical protein
MKLRYETVDGTSNYRKVTGVTITGQYITAGDHVVAEIGMHNGQVCWLRADSKEPIGWLEVKP